MKTLTSGRSRPFAQQPPPSLEKMVPSLMLLQFSLGFSLNFLVGRLRDLRGAILNMPAL